MNEPSKKRVKKRKKIDRQARIRHLKMIKIGAVAAVLILIISVIVILNPFGNRDGISIDKEDIETSQSEETYQRRFSTKETEVRKQVRLRRMKAEG